MKPKVLIIDDDPKICQAIRDLLFDKDIDSISVNTAEEGLNLIDIDSSIYTVLLDIWLTNSNGVDVLKKILVKNSKLPVVMISGHANIETAVKCLKLGAYDFLEKPFSATKLYLILQHSQDFYNLNQENKNLKSYLLTDVWSMVGDSAFIKKLSATIKILGQSDSRVIIFGENGVGKEIVARQIHLQSTRSNKPFVAINCAAIPEELIESELFGHEKGSFTGAYRKNIGKFQQANQGTLFLDEIGDMSLNTQAKILRALEDQKIQPVGAKDQIEIDARVISATNKNLKELINKGMFREDLYYRLAVVPIYLTALRERKEDVLELVKYFLVKFRDHSTKTKVISKEALQMLQNYSWPGNVRELRNVIERLVLLVKDDLILPEHLTFGEKSVVEDTDLNPKLVNLEFKDARDDLTLDSFLENAIEKNMNFKQAKSEFEKLYLLKQLQKNKGNITETASAISIERSYLHRKINKHKLVDELY